MTEFSVKFETVESVRKHPNADALDIVTLEGFALQFITQRGKFSVGEDALHIPIDSVLPDDLATFLNLGSTRRIKTVKLRGTISQGLLMSAGEVFDFNPLVATLAQLVADDLTDFLGIKKYEVPFNKKLRAMMNGTPCKPLTEGVRVYDIENAYKEKDVYDALRLLNIPLLITEKVEGTHFAVSMGKEYNFQLHTRRTTLDPDSDKQNPYTEFYNKNKETLHSVILGVTEDIFHAFKDKVVLRGELVGPGIQGNIYGLDEYRLYLFGFDVDMVGADHERVKSLRDEVAVWTYIHKNDYVFNVPLIAEKSLAAFERDHLESVYNISIPSQVSKTSVNGLAEGFVIQALADVKPDGINPFIGKVRSPEYLAASKN